MNNVTVVFGEFCQSMSKSAWKNFQDKPIMVRKGVGDYVPDWPLLIENNETLGAK